MNKFHNFLHIYLAVSGVLCTVSGYNSDNNIVFPDKDTRGKAVLFTKNGDVDISIRRKKWSEDKGRFLCCPLSSHHCKAPCNGLSCEAKCTVSCGLFNLFPCAAITCQEANSAGCVATSSGSCPTGWTTEGTKCFKVITSASDWLAAERTCISEGGTLAKIESAAENTAVLALMGGQVGWIGLQDFLNEGTFSWADGSSLGSYTNWANNQPDNAGQGQHCAVLRTQGDWNDVICGGTRAFVCQRNP